MKLSEEIHPRVAAALATSGAPFKVWRHRDLADTIASPQDFARAMGRPIECIAKSLLLRANTNPVTFGIGVCPVSARMDFAAIAVVFNARRMQVGSEAELQSHLGYPPGGVSPIGCGDLQVVMDSRLMSLQEVFVGGGIRGVEIEMTPGDLLKVCRALTVDFSM